MIFLIHGASCIHVPLLLQFIKKHIWHREPTIQHRYIDTLPKGKGKSNHRIWNKNKWNLEIKKMELASLLQYIWHFVACHGGFLADFEILALWEGQNHFFSVSSLNMTSKTESNNNKTKYPKRSKSKNNNNETKYKKRTKKVLLETNKNKTRNTKTYPNVKFIQICLFGD